VFIFHERENGPRRLDVVHLDDAAAVVGELVPHVAEQFGGGDADVVHRWLP
jgi:hypothetical protein